MFLLRYFSIPKAWRDLRRFLMKRKPYEMWFLALSMVITLAVLAGFAHDAAIKPVYRENIVYFKSWPADRTEAQILAQQKIDAPKEAAARAEHERALEERRMQFKRLDDKLDSWGF